MVKKIISAFVEVDLINDLKSRAELQKRTLSSIVAELLEQSLTKKEVDSNGVYRDKTI